MFLGCFGFFLLFSLPTKTHTCLPDLPWRLPWNTENFIFLQSKRRGGVRPDHPVSYQHRRGQAGENCRQCSVAQQRQDVTLWTLPVLSQAAWCQCGRVCGSEGWSRLLSFNESAISRNISLQPCFCPKVTILCTVWGVLCGPFFFFFVGIWSCSPFCLWQR